MNIRKKTLDILSTAFLVISLVVAGSLFTTDAFAPQDAKASANIQDDLEIETLGPACVGPPVNCFEPIVITPEAQ